MSVALRIIGAIAILSGCIWALQGLGILPGRLMHGQPQWIVNGVALAVAGVAVYWWGLRLGRRRARSGPELR